MKKKLLTLLTILLVALAFVSCSSKTSSRKVTESSAKEIAEKFVTYSEKYKNPKNKNQLVEGGTLVEMYDGDSNDTGISFINDPLLSNDMSLICKMNIKGEKFSFDDYPMYKEAFELYYGKNSKEIEDLTGIINKSLKTVTTEKAADLKTFKEDDKYLVGKLSLDADGNYEVTVICRNKYQ